MGKAKITLGKVELKHGVILAPMAGFSDRAMRKICRAHGAEYSVSEMVSATALCYNDKKTDLESLFLLKGRESCTEYASYTAAHYCAAKLC